MWRSIRRRACALLLAGLVGPPALAAGLTEALGRNETRLYSAPFPITPGRRLDEMALPERLQASGYRRVGQRPVVAGEFFWGEQRFWVYRRACRWGGRDRPPLLFGLELDGAGRIVRARGPTGEPIDDQDLWLEPELVAETLGGDRALRRPTRLEALPEHVVHAVLAAEDGRFFEHSGLDGRAIARAAIANLRQGGVVQGGSTITQQLVKNRDLSPQRTLGRKASEALRALSLEAGHDKEEILEAYLDSVYLGHRGGLAIHGLATAAEAYFSRTPEELSLAQATLLAAMIQAPNRLAPDRHLEAAETRRRWVLSRMAELGWATAEEVEEAARRSPPLDPTPPRPPAALHFAFWVRTVAGDEAPRDLAGGRGVVAESSLDAELQRRAEASVAFGLEAVRKRVGGQVSAALVALDGATGDVLAYVGGAPGDPSDQFDRARRARRQPGSTVKPLVVLEVLEACGPRSALHLASRVADEPLSIEQPDGPWTPRNDDGRFRGVVTLRQALVQSLNVPMVRLVRWCGLDGVAGRLRRAGLPIDAEPPLSFVLGAGEVSPLELAGAYTVFTAEGHRWRPRPLRRLERPSGRRLGRWVPKSKRVSSAESAFLVRDVLAEAVERGTARSVQIAGRSIAAKTGTSSERRDAWLAGLVGEVVLVVWVGRDDGSPLGLPGSQAAAPIWRRVAAQLPRLRPITAPRRPDRILELFVDPTSGLRVSPPRGDSQRELFRRGVVPRRDRRLWRDQPAPVIR